MDCVLFFEGVSGKKGEGVKGGGRGAFGSGEMNDVAVFFEHVDFLNGLDGLHVQFFKRCLQFLVIRARRFVDFFDFSPRCAFSAARKG